MSYLRHIELDQTGLPVPSPELEQERRVAVFDLQEGNSFRLKTGAPGPYRLRLGVVDRRAVFEWEADDNTSGRFDSGLGSLAASVRDYRSLCESYGEAVKTMPASRIEEIDEARRALHTEAAQELQTRIAPHAEVDEQTARRLFTLLCAMTDPAETP